MKRIAVINDLSGFGKCSLTAALPVISVMGIQACPLPTAILSNQTDFESYFCDDYTDKMSRIMDEWEKLKFVPDGIYSGFLAGAAQIDKVLEFIERFAGAHTQILIDPVMGDRGETYDIYTEMLRDRMGELASCAHVLTPNLTEMLLLIGGEQFMEEQWKYLENLSEERYMTEVEKLAGQLQKKYPSVIAVITGIHVKKEGIPQMGNLICENGEYKWILAEKRGGSYSGTGDLFASIMSAGLVKGWPVEQCVKKAVTFLGKAIYDAVLEGRDRNEGVCFEKYLVDLIGE